MKNFFLVMFVLGLASPSFGVNSVWVDGNGLEWSLQQVPTSYWREKHRCEALRLRLPTSEDFFEATDFGLLNPEKNTAFGKETGSVDWIWAYTHNSGLSYGNIASRQGDTAVDNADARHWAFCVRHI